MMILLCDIGDVLIASEKMFFRMARCGGVQFELHRTLRWHRATWATKAIATTVFLKMLIQDCPGKEETSGGWTLLETPLKAASEGITCQDV